MELFNRRNLIIFLFVVFLFLRVFVSNPSMLLASDNLKFLVTAQNFPNHTLYNNQLYLLHPPVYPYVIYFLTSIFQEDYIAATFLSLLSASVAFFLIYGLIILLTKSFNITFFTLVFYTLSVNFIPLSRLVSRESFLFLLIILTLYFYVKGVKLYSKNSIWASAFFGVLLALTSDFVIFVLPALVLSYIIFNKEKLNFRA